MLTMVEWCRTRSSSAAVSTLSTAKALSQLPKVRFEGSEEHHVLGALDEGEAGQFHDLLAGRVRWRSRSRIGQGFDGGEAGLMPRL